MICNRNPEYDDIWTAEDEQQYLEELREALSIFDEPEYDDDEEICKSNEINWATTNNVIQIGDVN